MDQDERLDLCADTDDVALVFLADKIRSGKASASDIKAYMALATQIRMRSPDKQGPRELAPAVKDSMMEIDPEMLKH